MKRAFTGLFAILAMALLMFARPAGAQAPLTTGNDYESWSSVGTYDSTAVCSCDAFGRQNGDYPFNISGTLSWAYDTGGVEFDFYDVNGTYLGKVIESPSCTDDYGSQNWTCALQSPEYSHHSITITFTCGYSTWYGDTVSCAAAGGYTSTWTHCTVTFKVAWNTENKETTTPFNDVSNSGTLSHAMTIFK